MDNPNYLTLYKQGKPVQALPCTWAAVKAAIDAGFLVLDNRGCRVEPGPGNTLHRFLPDGSEAGFLPMSNDFDPSW